MLNPARWARLAVLTGLWFSVPEAAAQPGRAPVAAKGAELAEAKELRAQAVKLHSEKNFAKAVPLLERALYLREKALGPNHLDVASVVSDLAELALEQGDVARAEPLYLRAIAIVEKQLGDTSSALSPLLTNLSIAKSVKKEYASAIPLAQRALAIREKAEGPEAASVARSLKHLSTLYAEAGDITRALPLMERYCAIVEKVLGPEHINITGSLVDLAQIHRRLRDFPKAVKLLERVVTIFEQVRGKHHPDVADPLQELAVTLEQQGSYAQAIAVEERSLALREAALGKDHPGVAESLHILATMCIHAGSFGRAIELLERSLAIRERALGKDHRSVGVSLNNLGEAYLLKGDYRRAEPLFQRALAILEKADDAESTGIGILLNNVASIYLLKGESARAKALFQRALAIREKALGKDHPDIAAALGNIAEAYLIGGDYTAAEPLMLRALFIREKALGQSHPLTAMSAYTLGALYLERGDPGRAEPLLERALAIQEKALGQDHPALAQTLNGLATLRQDAKDHAKAEALFLRALAIQEKALGPDHPEVAIMLHNLATLYEAKGRIREALDAYARANEIRERNLALIIGTGADDQKFAYMSTLVWLTHSTVSLHLREAPGDAAAARLALTTILRRKGRVLDAMTDSMVTLRKRLAPSDRVLFDRLASVRMELSRAFLYGGVAAEPAAQRQAIGRLEDEARRLEEAVSRRSDEFRVQAEPVTVERVKAALPEGAALVEIFVYRPFDARAPFNHRYGQPRYAGYVLRRSGAIAAVDLGSAARVDAQVNAFREALRSPTRRDVKTLGRALDQLVFRPIRALLGGARLVLLAPDGALNLIPFGALVDEEGRYLVERTSFAYLSSGRDLLRFAIRGEGRQGPVIVADPDFDHAAGTRPEDKEKATDGEGTSGGLAGVRFFRLLGTAKEAKAIAATVPGSEVLTGARATKAALAELRGPRILHIATHGFFLHDPPLEREGQQGHELDHVSLAATAAARATNPLLQSGLAFVGANARGSTRAAGILTALEASGIDLYGTRLVVLSACETGLGDVKNGNGVYGLRRALVIAGAQTQVMSLWSIDDQATRDLMIAYYKGLESGGGRTETLRQVQLEMLARPRVAHPYYWASFIASGDPRTLDGKQVQPSLWRVTPGLRGCGCAIDGQARGEGGAVGLALIAALAARRLGRRRRMAHL
jgi:MYXO-CTERM domain-containing protein